MPETSRLPPPLPPAERTVGQVVAESIRAYGHDFWRCLLLGLPLAVIGQIGFGANTQVIGLWLFSPLFTASYIGASMLVLAPPLDRRRQARALLVGILVWLPVPLLLRAYVLPAIAWLAFYGLAVPVVLVEGLGVRAALNRARKLGAADYVHALGSLCTLVIVVGLSYFVLVGLLHSQAETARRVAEFLATLLLSPLFYLGSALLYLDQAARIGSRRRDAGLHPPVDADAAGRADAALEPRPPAAGES
jgi:hypothetical protein